MNAPPVQYAKTSDGYDIAFSVQGEGEPLVVLPFSFSHAQTIWTESSATPLMQALSRRFCVYYYDGRGQGLSKRGLTPNLTMDSLQLDLRAVLERAGLDKPVFLADNPMGHVAVRFAVQSPQRVKALALMHSLTSLAAQVSWVGALARQNWDYFLRVQSGLTAPDAATEVERLTARVERLKARTTQADFVRFCEIFSASDVSEVLPKVEAPALVIYTSSQGFVTQEESARTAALLPNGRLVVVDGPTFFGEADAVVSAIEGLLGEVAESKPPAEAGIQVLSPREVEVLRLLAAGRSNQQIADCLVISLNTANRHVSNIYAKTGAANRAEAVTYAHRCGLAG